jgi:ketosteroid isomerase-like protein
MTTAHLFLLVLALVACLLCWSTPSGAEEAEKPKVHIARAIDDFHDAAAKSDANRYFEHLTKDAVFLGTDASERWTKPEFEAFARPYFDEGKGWTYTSTTRHITLAPGKTHAFFDELLENEHYGTCRGSGVLRLEDGRWRIAQYNLSIPIPNALTKDFVGRIRSHAAETAPKK